MARSMWKGAIQFGLVTIPVKMYLATESKGISFNMLHSACHGRIQMKTYCPTDDEMIERSDTVRGYEVAPDQYVVISDEDLSKVPLKTVRSIQIEQFVPVEASAEATRFVKQAYYLEPEPVARKAFFLLKQVLAAKGLRAVCKIVLRDREQLAALDPFSNTILLSTLYWPDEVRSVGDLSIPEDEADAKPAEIAMAEQLVAMMSGEFDPKAYHDEYREALMGIIDAKAAGEAIAEPAAAPTARVTDLVAALEASVAAAKAARAAAAPEPVAVSSGKRSATAKEAAPVPVGVPVMADESEAETVPARRRKSA
jgi:DNA end-binding protein Ku